jgi:SecD/SecF fusion protein
VLATSAVLGAMSRTRLMGSRFALGVGKADREGPRWHLDFIGKSKWFFSGSGVILVIGALAIAGAGINFGIDFESGTRVKTPLAQDASVNQVRETISPLGYGDARSPSSATPSSRSPRRPSAAARYPSSAPRSTASTGSSARTSR